MNSVSDEGAKSPRSGIEVASDLLDMARDMVAQRFRREHPGCSEESVRAAVDAWMLDRPGAPFGDGPGRLRPTS